MFTPASASAAKDTPMTNPTTIKTYTLRHPGDLIVTLRTALFAALKAHPGYTTVCFSLSASGKNLRVFAGGADAFGVSRAQGFKGGTDTNTALTFASLTVADVHHEAYQLCLNIVRNSKATAVRTATQEALPPMFVKGVRYFTVEAYAAALAGHGDRQS